MSEVQYAMHSQDILATLRALRKLRDELTEIAGDVIEIAADTTTLSQRKLAEALDVPPSTLRGLRS